MLASLNAVEGAGIQSHFRSELSKRSFTPQGSQTHPKSLEENIDSDRSVFVWHI